MTLVPWLCSEAMSSGLPVITSAFNGASGVIDHGIDGFVISNLSDSDEISDYMLEMLDQKRLKQFSSKAISKSLKFSLEENHERMIQVFIDAAQERTLFQARY